MKLIVKNYQINSVVALCKSIYPQRMLIGDKLKLKENIEKLSKKAQTIDDLRLDIIIENGGTKEAGLEPAAEGYANAVKQVNELYNLETEISISEIALPVLERFELDENIDLEAVLILSGTYVLPVAETAVEETKEVALVPVVE